MTVPGNGRSREQQYDPRRCITAAELRSVGVDVPNTIPNTAWIPKRSIVFSEVETDQYPVLVEAVVSMQINEPFRWVEEEAVDLR